MKKVGFGGGCHWCTEGIFTSLVGVTEVQQGWISSTPPFDGFSEAVIVHFDEQQITLKDLIDVHLHTHSCTSTHQLRTKYRSAVYAFNAPQAQVATTHLCEAQADFEKTIITKVYPFSAFKGNEEKYLNYYQNDPEKPFCKTNISPKLRSLMKEHSRLIDPSKVKHLN